MICMGYMEVFVWKLCMETTSVWTLGPLSMDSSMEL